MSSHNPMPDTNDPRLTAYVLGELAPAEVAQIEAELQASPELRATVADIRRATETISNVFLTESSLHLTPEQKSELLAKAESVTNFDVHSAAANVTPSITGEHYRPTSTSAAHLLKIAIAAGLVGVMIGGAYYFSKTDKPSIAASDKAVLEVDSSMELSNENFVKRPQDEVADRLADSSLSSVAGDTAKTDKPENSSATASKTQNFAVASADKLDIDGSAAGIVKVPKRAGSLQVRPSKPKATLRGLAFKNNPKAKRTKLELAQQSINRSALSSINLKVVPTAAKRTLERKSDTESESDEFRLEKTTGRSSTIFKLQISDQDAKRMVDLLSSHVDPQQHRKLSFNDLIDFPKNPSIENSETAMDDAVPNDKGDTPESIHHASQMPAVMLAMKLREFINQSRSSRNRNKIADKTPTETIKLPTRKNLAESDEDTVKPIQLGIERSLPEMAPSHDQIISAGRTAGQPMHLNEFNFDYTQVIQQLKSNLEIRNQSVQSTPGLKR